MSALLASSEEANGASTTSSTAVRRQPFYLISRGQPLFAWLHDAEPQAGSRHGIVICPPLHHEQIHSHRALRHLADALAAAGFLVCRFDYHGTGDSAGNDEEPDRVATWLTNIRDGIAWLRDHQGCRQVSVIGLRLGALLALQAVVEQPVSDLVLWAPVINGRQYVRELQALNMTGETPLTESEGPGDLEAAGFVVTPQTVDDLSNLQATRNHPRCRRALIVARDDFSEDRRLVDHLSPLGIVTQQIRQPGYAAMMAEPHHTEVPRQAIEAIVNWLRSGSTESSPQDAGCERQELRRAEITLPQQPIRELAMTIGGQPALFGILAEPAGKRSADLPLIVLLNAGAAYRVGPNRLNVLLARQLAVQGFRCLRLDLAGLGDSVAHGLDRENDPYNATMFRDIDLVLKHAQTHLGETTAVLMGLCSGAYAAFQSAAQFTNSALVESVVINPLTYFWKDGMSIQSPEARDLKAYRYYMHAALQPMKWWRLISGYSKIDIFGAIALVANRFRRRSRPKNATSVEIWQPEHDGEVGHPQHDDLPGDLKRAVSSGRHLAFFFSSGDPGYPLLMFRAWRLVNSLRRTNKVTCVFIENADHTFSRRQPRRSMIQSVAQHLCSRYKDVG
ncbi:MAG: alpha/beta hydrolase [Planctomycetia bacterium]|nr:alpha/beta hydrolase [Planctomycetia bacterium]